MKLRMAENSLFAILLRSPWWISVAIAFAIAAVAGALLPDAYRAVGAVSGLPFAVIGAIAAWRQWHLPSAAQIERTRAAVGAMAWPAFASALEQAFARDGCRVQAGDGAAVDFVVERQGRRKLVAARRWKSARIGVESLRALQAANGRLDITRAQVKQGDVLAVGTGSLGLTPRGALNGELKVTITNFEKLIPLLGIDRMVAQMVPQSTIERLAPGLDKLVPGLGGVLRGNSSGPAAKAAIDALGARTELEARAR